MRQFNYILFLLLISATSGFGVYAAENPSLKSIRVIFGYESIGRWEQQFTEAISQIFLDDTRVIFQTDYLPLNAQDPASFTMFSTLEQARSSEADAVIAVRFEASAFVSQWRESFFPDIPRIYVIPGNELETTGLESETDAIVPSVAEAAARETFELLPQLFPDIEHIYILSDDSVPGAAYLILIENAIQEADLQQTIHYLVGLTPSEISAELNRAPQNTAAVYGLYIQDRTGQLYRGGDVASLVSEQTEIPIFGLFDGALNSGIIGGSMTTATLYAKKAAERTLAILFDDTPPPNLETPAVYLFDAIQLDRFGIDRDLLPEGSEIINDNPSLLHQYRWQFAMGGTVLLILLFLIVALWQSLRRRNKAEAEREVSSDAMLEAQRIAHVGSWQYDPVSTHSKWTPELYYIHGLDPKFPPPDSTEYSKSFTPASWERLSYSILHIVESGNPFELELEMVKSDGTHGWLLTKGEAVRDVSGSIVGLRGTAIDITERRAISEQLRQAQKMEAVGQLTGGIAHDFNNILAIVMGYLEIAQIDASGDKKILGSVDRAFEGATRGTVLIDKLLGFSRVHSSETSLTSVNQLVEDMDDLLAKSLTVAIEVETELEANLWPVNVDAGNLEGAILNLALNARDAMPDGGRLGIETANRVLDADFVRLQPEAKIGEYVMLSVSDNGVGMLPEIMEKMLEPFFTTKSEGQGTGLGLSMVYGFVKRSGGFITIVSEPDAGTSIRLFLPHERRAEQVETSTIGKEELPRGDETILVVDDEEELRKLAAANLERLGYKVLTAFDAKSALALIEDKPYIELLFSDVIMPGELDGYDLSIAAKNTHPTLKVLLTSGFTRRKRDDSNSDNPMIDELTRNLLQKPYSNAGLAKAVRNALD